MRPTTVLHTPEDVEKLCLSCGACCSAFRISFYWAETTACDGGQVPDDLTQQMTPYRSCMKGTSQSNPRCIALAGQVGQHVGCTIYPQRPSPCREFHVFDEHGTLNPRCNQAREKHGLPPLEVKHIQVV